MKLQAVKNHGVNDLARDTFLDGFKDYMIRNSYIWRHCWTYDGQTPTHEKNRRHGGSNNIDKGRYDGIFGYGETNIGADIIDYRSGFNYFKNIGCLVDNAGIDQKDNSRRLLRGNLTDVLSDHTSSVSVCLRVGIMFGFSHCGVQTFNNSNSKIT